MFTLVVAECPVCLPEEACSCDSMQPLVLSLRLEALRSIIGILMPVASFINHVKVSNSLQRYLRFLYGWIYQHKALEYKAELSAKYALSVTPHDQGIGVPMNV